MSVIHNTKFSKQEICDILDDIINIYPTSRYHEVWALLHTRGLYRQMLNYYLNELKDPNISSRMKILRELQKDKLVDGLLNKRSDVSETGAIFILKCNYGFMEEDKRQRLDLDKKRLDMDKDIHADLMENINIAFVGDDETD